MIYIALLRGINVGGHKKILMKDLREIFLKNGLKDVKTYIQSGNVVFNSDEDSEELSKKIATYIYKEYGFEVFIFVKSIARWEFVMQNNPYSNEIEVGVKKKYVTFLSRKPSKEDILDLKKLDFSPDSFQVKENLIYTYYTDGARNSKMTNALFEKKLKVTTTSRNWNTVNKLFTLASS